MRKSQNSLKKKADNMFTYADVNYYCNTYAGNIADKAQIENNLLLATCDIDRLTFSRIKKIGFDNLSREKQELIKRACCMQADYCFGSEENNNNISSYTAGNVSVSYDTTRRTTVQIENVSKSAYKLLKAAGLTHRCI